MYVCLSASDLILIFHLQISRALFIAHNVCYFISFIYSSTVCHLINHTTQTHHLIDRKPLSAKISFIRNVRGRGCDWRSEKDVDDTREISA